MAVSDGRATEGPPLTASASIADTPMSAGASVPGAGPADRIERSSRNKGQVAKDLWKSVNAHSHTMRRHVWLVVRIAVSVGILIGLLMRAHVAALMSVVTRMSPLLALAALGVGLITVVVSAEQWRQLLKSECINLRLGLATALYFLGITFNQFLPSSIGGDIVKAAYVVRLSGRGVGTASATLMARALGLIGLLVTALPVSIVASLLVPTYAWKLTIALACVALAYTLGLVALLRGPELMRLVGLDRLRRYRAGATLQDLIQTIAQYRGRWRVCTVTVIYSMLFYIASYLNYFLFGQALRMQSPFWFYWVAIPLASLATMLPISVNGYGVRGASLAVLFSMTGETTASALALALAMELQMLLFAVIGGGVIIALRRTSATPVQPATASSAVDAAPSSAQPHENQPISTTPMERAQSQRQSQTWRGRALIYLREALRGLGPTAQGELRMKQEQIEHSSNLTSVTRRPSSADIGRLRQRLADLGARRSVLVGVVAMIVLVAVTLVMVLRQTAQPRVTLYTVRTQTLTTYVGGGGVTSAAQVLTVAYPVSAQVTKVDVQVGQTVKPGQPLLSLDSAGLAAQLEQAYSQWQIAQSYLASLRATGATSSQLAAASQQAATAKNHYNTLNNEINSPAFNNGNIISTFSGIVSSINIAPGSLFPADTKLMTINDISTIIVHTQFPLEDRAQVNVGAAADVIPAAVPTQKFTGSISAILPVLSSPGSDTFEAWVTVPNTSMQLFANEGVYVRVRGRQTLPAVPQLAIDNGVDDTTVFLYAAGKAHLVHIAIGARDGDMFGVSDGLHPGDRVIIVGQYQLSDGEAVSVAKTE